MHSVQVNWWWSSLHGPHGSPLVHDDRDDIRTARGGGDGATQGATPNPSFSSRSSARRHSGPSLSLSDQPFSPRRSVPGQDEDFDAPLLVNNA